MAGAIIASFDRDSPEKKGKNIPNYVSHISHSFWTFFKLPKIEENHTIYAKIFKTDQSVKSQFQMVESSLQELINVVVVLGKIVQMEIFSDESNSLRQNAVISKKGPKYSLRHDLKTKMAY